MIEQAPTFLKRVYNRIPKRKLVPPNGFISNKDIHGQILGSAFEQQFLSQGFPPPPPSGRSEPTVLALKEESNRL